MLIGSQRSTPWSSDWLGPNIKQSTESTDSAPFNHSLDRVPGIEIGIRPFDLSCAVRPPTTHHPLKPTDKQTASSTMADHSEYQKAAAAFPTPNFIEPAAMRDILLGACVALDCEICLCIPSGHPRLIGRGAGRASSVI